MSINLDAIEAAARAAAKGSGGVWWDVEGLRHKPTLTKPDRTHIATMDPQTTLALVEKVRELEAEVESIRDALGADQ